MGYIAPDVLRFSYNNNYNIWGLKRLPCLC